MFNSLEEFNFFLKDKKIAVLGLGVSNVSLLKYLAPKGCAVTVFDVTEKEQLKHTILQFKDYENISYCLGKNYLAGLKGFDVIFKTPVIRHDIPELEREKERGALITSEMEVFGKFCSAEIIGVTGSDGKTTTTTLIYNILKESGYKCWLGGNIGTPLIDKIEEIKSSDKVVLELSSFQLLTMKDSPNVAVITNISPNHLDIHKSMDEYIEAKKNIFRYQEDTDILVLNHENDITRAFGGECRGKARYFSRISEIEAGTYVKNGAILFKEGGMERKIMKTGKILLPGLHNLENYLAAIAAVAHLADKYAIEKVASTFKGVEHRIEHVREINGINFYNDAIATSPTRTIASISSFDKKVILIAGGYDKKIPYDSMGKVIAKKVKVLVLVGQTAPLIEKSLYNERNISGKGSDIQVFKCNTLEEAVKRAYLSAERGDIVILSPASASFDMFRNFEEKGNKYKEIVNSLDNIDNGDRAKSVPFLS